MHWLLRRRFTRTAESFRGLNWGSIDVLWLKAFHLIFVVCWFAGIFYLPRLYVNMAASPDPAVTSQLTAMAHRLYRFMTALAIPAVGFGTWLLVAYWPAYREAAWMHVKLVLVAALIIYHLLCGYLLTQFKNGSNRFSHVFYRWFNEIPVLILLSIVILVIVRPF